MKRLYRILFIIGLNTFLLMSVKGEQLAFPGAEGFGRFAKGGRGGRVIEVTNLDAKGPGSLRAACKAKGPRTIVFRTGGVIDLQKEIRITNPYVTIAGQTAPGDGICLRGAHLIIGASHVIVRYLRVRPGDLAKGPNPRTRDGITVARKGKTIHDVIVDHCSVSWAVDENMSTWYSARDITFQWCISSEALYDSIHPKGEHSMGILIGDESDRVSIHHCLIAHNNYRNPQLAQHGRAEIISNLIYNYGHSAIVMNSNDDPSQAVIEGNVVMPGKDSNLKTLSISFWSKLHPDSQVYIGPNKGPGRPEGENDPWAAVQHKNLKSEVRVDDPPFEPNRIPIHEPKKLRALILDYAGAVMPKRDAVDRQLVTDVRNQSGQIIDSQKDVGGWPEYRTGEPPEDADHDGMPDSFERNHPELDPNDPADRNETSSGGYTWLERYLHSLVPSADNKYE